MKEDILPKRIIDLKGVESAQNLLVLKEMQISLHEPITTTINDGYIILDFGKEMCGGVRILTFLADSVTARIRFGESVTEACSEIGEKNSTNDHSLRDFTVQLQNFSDMTFGNTGFRFVRIDVVGKAVIKSVSAINNILKRKAIYSYSGKDREIKEIFSVAKRTIDLCVSSGYVWDGVKRDRLVWVGDMHPEMLALTALYGRNEEIERSIDFARKTTPLPNWMDKMPTYTLWWLIIVADYYSKTKCEDFAKRQLDYYESTVDFVCDFVKENGEMTYPSYFLDWPTAGTADVKEGVRAINIYALTLAVKFLSSFGRNTEKAEKTLIRLKRVKIISAKKQVLGLKYFAVGLSEEEKAALLKGGAKGVSTFMSYYILKAIASFDKESAISIMKEFYGGMLSRGATTFWEDFDVDNLNGSGRIDEFPKEGEKDIHGDYGAHCYLGFRHSLCHGWSAGVIKFIQEEC